tara:strand:+ start:415 stop:573 length:159 start_codon:yes stop_codon:yes gene_type:complete
MNTIVVVLIFIGAVLMLNNRYIDTGTSYLLSGILAFLFVVGLIFLVASTFWI